MFIVSCDRCYLLPQLARCLQAIKVFTHVQRSAQRLHFQSDCGAQTMSTSALKRRKPAAPGSPAIPSKKKSNRKPAEKLSPTMVYLRANYSVIAFALYSAIFLAAKSGLFPGATGYVEMKHPRSQGLPRPAV